MLNYLILSIHLLSLTRKMFFGEKVAFTCSKDETTLQK